MTNVTAYRADAVETPANHLRKSCGRKSPDFADSFFLWKSSPDVRDFSATRSTFSPTEDCYTFQRVAWKMTVFHAPYYYDYWKEREYRKTTVRTPRWS